LFNGSFVFLVHLLAYGLISGVTFAGWILNSRFTAEPDLPLKIALGAAMRSVGFFSPIAAIVLLATGIGNIINVYTGTGTEWYQHSWLVVKVVLFGILLTNGALFGPSLARKRMKVVRKALEDDSPDLADEELKPLNAQIRWFFIVQTILILGILFFSVYGDGKHPGIF
jgi:uncharacterized membrane protein